jgi:hypothetical protein
MAYAALRKVALLASNALTTSSGVMLVVASVPEGSGLTGAGLAASSAVCAEADVAQRNEPDDNRLNRTTNLRHLFMT